PAAATKSSHPTADAFIRIYRNVRICHPPTFSALALPTLARAAFPDRTHNPSRSLLAPAPIGQNLNLTPPMKLRGAPAMMLAVVLFAN
ncbi:hypothetical protein, partial [Methylosinus sp. Sm6]|uniref:hypothetical protein n=1 Tax=Methylosinus sp. Sm6 TaxID=2866948 RepID=UPI001C9918AB